MTLATPVSDYFQICWFKRFDKKHDHPEILSIIFAWWRLMWRATIWWSSGLIFSLQKNPENVSCLALLPLIQGPWALVSTQSTLGWMVEMLYNGGWPVQRWFSCFKHRQRQNVPRLLPLWHMITSLKQSMNRIVGHKVLEEKSDFF